MPYWPAAIADRDFDPREVEAITGVSHGQQRQWRVRYLDFRQASFIYYGPRKHGRWSWEGTQMIALFDRALTDLGSGDMARKVLMLDEEPGIIRNELDTYHFDHRSNDSGDLLIVGDLSRGKDASFWITGVSGLGTVLQPGTSASSLSPRHYILNFSAFQRDLHDRATRIIGAEID